MRRSLLLAAATAVALTFAGTGCNTSVRGADAPTCSADDDGARLLLVAQSVPTAQRIPCIDGYPAGWELGPVEVRDGRSSYQLEVDDGSSVEVVLERDCVVTGATEVATDERGTVRYDRVPSATATGTVRNYKFAGGCVTYRFQFSGLRSTLLVQASQAIGMVSRSEIDARFYGSSETDGGAK